MITEGEASIPRAFGNQEKTKQRSTTKASNQAVWHERQNALLRQSSLKGPQHLFVSYHSIINVMPKITSQIFWFTKY